MASVFILYEALKLPFPAVENSLQRAQILFRDVDGPLLVFVFFFFLFFSPSFILTHISVFVVLIFILFCTSPGCILVLLTAGIGTTGVPSAPTRVTSCCSSNPGCGWCPPFLTPRRRRALPCVTRMPRHSHQRTGQIWREMCFANHRGTITKMACTRQGIV